MTIPRSARRMIVMLVLLVAIDPLVPVFREQLEAKHYEEEPASTRFENSDFFGLGPFVQYLREHPTGTRPRTVFLGNSVLFGYGLDSRDAVPAVYGRLSPAENVFNASINGLDSISAYLIAKAIAGSVDTVYLLNGESRTIDPLLKRLIPIDDIDLQRFQAAAPATSRLTRLAMHWRLYRDTYRIQAALFGTSTRQYVYLHKGDIARKLLASMTSRRIGDEFTPAENLPNLPAVAASIPLAASRDALGLQNDRPLAVELAEFFKARRKRVVLLQVRNYSEYLPEALVGAFNAAFSPHAAIIVVDVPESARYDDAHFTREGAAALARQLRRLADGIR